MDLLLVRWAYKLTDSSESKYNAIFLFNKFKQHKVSGFCPLSPTVNSPFVKYYFIYLFPTSECFRIGKSKRLSLTVVLIYVSKQHILSRRLVNTGKAYVKHRRFVNECFICFNIAFCLKPNWRLPDGKLNAHHNITSKWIAHSWKKHV